MSNPETTSEDRLLEALALVNRRLIDLADIVDSEPSYDAAGFLRATAKRCQRVLDGRRFGD